MESKKTTILAAIQLMLFSYSGCLYAWEKDTVYPITVLHTNDHHGHFWHNDNGEYGLAAQKTLIDGIRAEVKQRGGSVLLLSGGDVNTGVPESDLLFAEPDFKGMNLIGYDAMAIGNHEFDYPLEILRRQQQWSTFPFISANIYQKSSGKRLFAPYATFNLNGVKVAVVGLTTEDTVKSGNPHFFDDILFTNPTEEALKTVTELKQRENPDVVIAATHMGHFDDGNAGASSQGDVEMARNLPANTFDLIVGGHSQDPVCMAQENQKQIDYIPGTPCTPDRQNGTWIVQAHEWGKYVGRADFEFVNGRFTLVRYQLIPVNLKKTETLPDGTVSHRLYQPQIAHDKEMLTLLTPFQDKGQAELLKIIGSVNGELIGDRYSVRNGQTNLSRLVLESQIELTQADFAVINSGGVRTSIQPGTITYRDALQVLPFRNTVVYVDLTGEEIEQYLASIANMTVGSGYYPQLANVTLTTDGKNVSQIKIKGEPLKADKIYRMATLNAITNGGVSYPKLDDRPSHVNTGLSDAGVLADYIKKHSPLEIQRYQANSEIKRNAG
jgi:5'-nucleotidase/UDP-sugar diphosphatase